MDWVEISIKVKTEYTEITAAIATMTVPYGIYIEDYSDMEEMLPKIGIVDYIDDALLAKDREHSIIHIYIPTNLAPNEAVSFIEERLQAEHVEYEISTINISEDEWANNWKEFYHPERIGENLVVCPSWERYEPKLGDLVLSLDPGSSFGTGKHETTRLCLEILEQTVKNGDLVLDMGCGSGILSIGALKLGAAKVFAVDIDKNAAATAAQNAKENGYLNDVYITSYGSVMEDQELAAKIGIEYDIIVANIVADVIMSMEQLFFGKLRSGGTLIVSGIIDTRADEVLDSLVSAGFVLQTKKELGGWVAASLLK